MLNKILKFFGLRRHESTMSVSELIDENIRARQAVKTLYFEKCRLFEETLAWMEPHVEKLLEPESLDLLVRSFTAASANTLIILAQQSVINLHRGNGPVVPSSIVGLKIDELDARFKTIIRRLDDAYFKKETA